MTMQSTFQSSTHQQLQQQRQQQKHGQPLRIKCIVLGSAGAGKTSFLRRYFTGKFEHGNRKSTMGADFYSKIVSNPWYTDSNVGTINNKHDTSKKNGDDNSSNRNVRKDNHDENKRYDKKGTRKKRKKKDKKQSRGGYNDSVNQLTSLVVGGSDTTCAVGTKHNGASKNSLTHTPISCITTTTPHIALQIWDTAGKERLLISSSSTKPARLSSRLGDSFFNHADAAILIYDATSSASFLQTIQWYSELLERVHNATNDNELLAPVIGKRTQFPILVVATKLDQLTAEQSKQATKKIVPQRDILGLRGKQFNGQEYHYEYATEYNTKYNKNNSSDNTNKNAKGSSASKLSYGLECGAWTTDKEYQDYLKVAEDECFPDRYMVRLWCKRNGLEHVEVSALDGMGVNEAVDTMIELALKATKVKMAATKNYSSRTEGIQNTNGIYDTYKGHTDFHQRYRSKDEDNCNFCRCLFRR